jgi:hypothetical protein
MSLSGLNDALEQTQDLPDTVWDDWLWGTDPEEPYHMDVLLNRNQLLGLLVCRYKHAHTDPCPHTMPPAHRMTIMSKQIHEMTWRELKDTVANILFEWPAFLDRIKHNIRAKQNMRQVLHLVNLCAARFGGLAGLAGDETLLDDPAETQPCKQHERLIVLTPAALRRMVGSLLIMYRHIHLLSVCIKVSPQSFALPITKYHYEASQDQFNLLCMHMSLPVAARLNYRHDFPGMYNHVSQVVYFHNSQYSRIPRHPLADVATAPAVHVLPAIQELYPEVPIRYEEDHFDPNKSAGWYWLLLAGRLYLVSPEPAVYHAESIADLLKHYMDRRSPQ